MEDQAAAPGKTTIAPDVIETIARLTTLNVPGVSRMSRIPAPILKAFFRRGHVDQGVVVNVSDNSVSTDLYVVLKQDQNIKDVSQNIQVEVSRALSEMLGMHVGSINIHVEDIDYFESA